jgi:hypothetical protein
MIVIFDNRRMAAIGALQRAQYGAADKASDGVAVDYVRMASSIAGVHAVFGCYDSTTLQRAAVERRKLVRVGSDGVAEERCLMCRSRCCRSGN